MTLAIRERADVLSSDGTRLGEVERLVVDPSRAEITHFVVSKGVLFPEERVVPVDIVSESSAEEITLDSAVEFDELPLFEEVHYVTMDEKTASRAHPDAVESPLIWGSPALISATGYPLLPPSQLRVVERNVPEGSHVVRAGTDVISAHGENIGKVRETNVTDDGVVVSLVIDPGWFQTEKIVPAHFVARIEENQVLLAVGSETVGQLEL